MAVGAGGKPVRARRLHGGGRDAAGGVRSEGCVAIASTHAVPPRRCRCGRRRWADRRCRRHRRGSKACEERTRVPSPDAALVGRRRADAARASRRDLAGGNRLRGRRSHGRPRHEPPALRELPTRRPKVASAAAGSRSAGRNRCGRPRRPRDLGRRRGAGRHDRGGALLNPDRRASPGAAREPADTEARRRSCGARRSRLRHRGWTRAWSHRELGERIARRGLGVPGERQRGETAKDRDRPPVEVALADCEPEVWKAAQAPFSSAISVSSRASGAPRQ